MKNILIVGPVPPPFGGVASHLNDLIPSLAPKGFNITTITSSKKNNLKNFETHTEIRYNFKNFSFKTALGFIQKFVSKIFVKKDLPFRKFVKSVFFSNKINSIIETKNIDIIFIYTIENGYTIPMIRSKHGNKVKIVLMIFGAFYLNPIKYVKEKKYLASVFQGSNKITASSDYCGCSILDVLNLKFSVEVIYIGVDQQEYISLNSKDSLRAKFNIPSSAFVMLFLARMEKAMGLDFLLENLTATMNLDKDIYIIIAGAQGELSDQAQQIALKNEKVKYFCNIPFNQKVEFYNVSDLLIAPTIQRHACMGVSIKEAMSCETPIIASNSGGIPEALEDGVNGYLVPIENGIISKSIYLEKIKNIIENKSQLNAVGKNGRKTVIKKFSHNSTTKKYFDLIKDLQN